MRYAAAMYFFQRGMMSERELEAYRASSKIDGRPTSPAQDAIANLAEGVAEYISGLEFPGKKDAIAGMSRWAHGTPRPVSASAVAACSHLPAAFAAMTDRKLAALLEAAAPHLAWANFSGYPIVEIGEAFAHNNVYATLIGEGAPYPAEDFDVGLFLIAPYIFYRDHNHAAPELYAPLTGPHGWRFECGTSLRWQAAGIAVWNEPHRPHAIMAGEVPFLAIYCWTRDVNSPARVLFCDDWAVIEGAPEQHSKAL